MTKIKLLAQLFIRAYQKCNIATEGTSSALSSSGKEKNTAAANNDLDGHQFIISYAQFGRDSLFYMILGTEGWAAVIGLIRRSPDLRWPEADVEGESVKFLQAASLRSPLRPVMKTQRDRAMQYKGLEITAFEQEPGKWCARIVAANGRPLRRDDRKLLEPVTSATAVDALALAMVAVDAAGLFFHNANRGTERFWRMLLRTSRLVAAARIRLPRKNPGEDVCRGQGSLTFSGTTSKSYARPASVPVTDTA